MRGVGRVEGWAHAGSADAIVSENRYRCGSLGTPDALSGRMKSPLRLPESVTARVQRYELPFEIVSSALLVAVLLRWVAGGD